MCLILFAYRHHPDYPLIVAANRDEFYQRPTEDAGFWPEAPRLLAGRDLKLGGTWLGITRQGRFAALTNYRDPRCEGDERRSRGVLVRDYLLGDEPPVSFLETLARKGDRIKGFNILAGAPGELWYASNCGAPPRRVAPGLHGLSNHLLDTPWPKVARTKEAFAALLEEPQPDEEGLFALLADTRLAPDEELPDTGVGLARERVLSAPFIRSPDYGTCSSTLLLINTEGGVRFIARAFQPGEGPARWRERRFCFALG